MASRYWVGGGSSTNWNATANTNWAATSGGAGNQSVPTTTDDVFFDANSGTGNAVISASITVMSVNCTGYAGTITHNTSVTLTINTGSATSLLFSVGMTYTPASASSLVTFTHTSGTADITSNGKRLGGLTINGAGGTTRLLDALRVDTFATSTLTLTAGTFNANNFNVTLTLFAGSNSNTRVLTMGSGTWTIGALAGAVSTIWTVSTTTGLTLNRGTSTIVIASNTLAATRNFLGGSQTYYNLTVNANSAAGLLFFTGANTFNNVTVAEGNCLTIPSGIMTVQGTLSMTGTTALPALLIGTGGSQATVSAASGTHTVVYGGIRDVLATGGGTFTATNTYNFGNNAGWSITPPASADLATIISDLAAVKAKTDNLPSDPADASVISARFDTLDTSIGSLNNLSAADVNAEVDTAIADAFTFTVAGQVDANVQYVNDVQVTGVGSEADPWGP